MTEPKYTGKPICKSAATRVIMVMVDYRCCCEQAQSRHYVVL
ncbi:MAG: hypothetical protein R3E67_01500 [Pseudomonadales bacterium]